MYLNKIRFSQAAADLLRSIIGTPTLRVPLSVKSKVTFICLIFLFMTITSYLQGKLYTAITTPLYHYFVSTKFDLLTMNYKIYVRNSIFNKYFADTTFYDQFHFVKSVSECAEKVEQNQKYNFVCVDLCSLVKYFTCESSQIHVVKDDGIPKYYLSFISRDNFSLFKRLSNIFRYLNEAGLIVYNINHQNYFGYKKPTENSKFSISLNEISLAFILLVSGLLLSYFAFLIELIFNYCKRVQPRVIIKHIFVRK